MRDELHVMALVAGTGLATGLLVWVLVIVGSGAAARWRDTFTRRAGFQAREFFVFIDPRRLFAAQLALMALAPLVGWLLTGSSWMALVLLALAGVLPRWLYAVARRRRWQRFDEQLPDALLMLAGALRAGVGLGTAIQQLVAQAQGPVGQEFSLVLREQRMGVSLDDALAHLGRRVPTDAATLVVSALRIAGETGGALADTLERTASTIRSRLQMEGKIDALTAQGRLQAWVVGALPLVLLAVLQHMEPKAMALMWTTPAGWGALTLIAGLLGVGVYLIRRIVAIDV